MPDMAASLVRERDSGAKRNGKEKRKSKMKNLPSKSDVERSSSSDELKEVCCVMYGPAMGRLCFLSPI